MIRILTLLLPVALAGSPTVDADALRLLHELEGFTATARWDVNAARNGYGTPAEYPGEQISRDEAARRAEAHYHRHYNYLAREFPHLTDQQTAALAVMRYNVGSFGPDLTRAIRSGDPHAIAKQMKRYTKSRGKVLDGLVERRSREAEFLLRWFSAPYRKDQKLFIKNANKVCGYARHYRTFASSRRAVNKLDMKYLFILLALPSLCAAQPASNFSELLMAREAAAQRGDTTIVLTADLILTETWVIAKDTYLAGNGQTIYCNGCDPVIRVLDGVNLCIEPFTYFANGYVNWMVKDVTTHALAPRVLRRKN